MFLRFLTRCLLIFSTLIATCTISDSAEAQTKINVARLKKGENLEVKVQCAKIPADALLVIKPGIKVAVEMQTADANSAAARERIVKSLTERGIRVVPDSPIKLIGTIGPGQTEDVNYRSFGQFGSQGTPVAIQGNVATLSYQVNGETV